MEQLSTTVKFDATEAKEIIDKIIAESDVLQTIKEFHEKHKWQPIETMPIDEWVLTSDGFLVQKTKTLKSRVCVNDGQILFKWNPTHWMPLPEPPKS